MQRLWTLFFLASSTYALTLSQTPESNSLVVYNSNVALVHESKQLSITPDETRIIYPDVASSIITNSVGITLPKSVTLYSQQYRYDKLTKTKLLDAYIGKPIGYKTTTPTLLAHQGNEAIVRRNDGSIVTINTQDIHLPAIPKELLIKPSLVWNVKTTKKVDTTLTLDYLIKNIRWSSDYVLHLHKNSADLTGWITIDNKSGKVFHNTQLYLLAGDINRAHTSHPVPVRYMKTMVTAESIPVEEKAHEGYHIYTIPFAVNLANNEKTQIKFFTKNDISITRTYSTYLNNPLYMRGEIKNDVTQYVELQKLDIPLPKGVVRTYSPMKDTNILLGETSIKHTPKNTPVKLKLGTNFDIKVKQTLLKRDKNDHYIFADIRYTITNNSDTQKTVTLLIPFNKNKGSKIQTQRSFRFTKGNLATFTLDIDPNTTLSFDVHFQSKK